jgi:hypothetical protein
MSGAPGPTLTGKGPLRLGERTICTVNYVIYLASMNGHAAVVEFEPKPPVKDGEVVHLTLEDGRELSCHILHDSPYWAVMGDGPTTERRSRARKENA